MPTAAPRPQAQTTPVVRLLMFLGGSIALVLGVIGAVLPLLPTTPFVLLAAGCYARGHAPAYRWLRANRYFGPICRSGQEGRYLPPRAKAIAIAVTALSFAFTLVFAVQVWWLRGVVSAFGAGVLIWLLRMPTAPRPPAVPAKDAA